MRYRKNRYPEREARSGLPVTIILTLMAGLCLYLLVGNMLSGSSQQTRVFPPDSITVAAGEKNAP
ncbi:hypothetical protein PYH38_001889 [Sinorhizobium numidicum]|uniref:Uncharacterized protein n=1 Tax=Sinorhizobium numidicum TaxID=680248 RepID=A0ABY8CP64_9HYPH|nr:hypothetical protein [Sinorhizobium numidicum]WEX80449.1 hypothetical protein PYH38_001889 [Sinorhizobium numidicum]